MQQSEGQQINHIYWPDIAKGIGIILVVLGHGMFPIHSLIDSFHMPLFFVLAGLFVSTSKYSIGEYLRNRFMRIMIPFGIYALVVALYALPMGWKEVVHHVSSLWFLYTIFFASSLYYIIRKLTIIRHCNFIIVAVALLLAVIPVGGGNIWNALVRILYAVVFIHVGFLYKRYCDTLNTNWIIMITALFIFLFCNALILKQYSMLNISYYSGTLFQLPMYLLWPTTLSGCYFVVIISKKIGTANVLQFLGRNSLAMYALHIPLIWRINKLIGGLSHYEQITYKLLYGLLEYCVVFTIVMLLIWGLHRALPSRYYKYLGISK